MADLPTTLRSQAFIASGKHDQFLYTTAADEIWKLRREAREAAERIQQLTNAARQIKPAVDGMNENYQKGWNTKDARRCLQERSDALAALLKDIDNG